MKLVLLLVLAASVIGCGDDVATLEQAAAAYCEVETAQNMSCGGDPVDPQCESKAVDCFGIFRPEVRDPYIACLEPLACGATDDACKLVSMIGLTLDEATNSFHSACAMAFSGCGVPVADICYFEFGTPEVNAQLTACTTQACDQIEPCLAAVLSVCERRPYSVSES